MNSETTFLDGTCYIGAVGGEIEPCNAVLSIAQLKRRDGDSEVNVSMQTKGYVGSEWHVQRFLTETKHDFIFLMDMDMQFAPLTLEALRKHGRAFVSGFYTRRELPTFPVWYEEQPLEMWPQTPVLRVPEVGRLHRIGGTGWGCALIHRRVFEAVGKLLKGQGFVREDPMAVYPFDLEAVLRGEEKLRPLTGDWDVVGSDVRFCWFARKAGFTIWGDPDVRAGHIVNTPIGYAEFATNTEALAALQRIYTEQLPGVRQRPESGRQPRPAP